ncbi:MAG: type IV pilus secretin PilQ [Deltaproteobacteria bacterium]|nr:type IV pilus secretin PilQ [Deltaproteobacteria bacterium]
MPRRWPHLLAFTLAAVAFPHAPARADRTPNRIRSLDVQELGAVTTVAIRGSTTPTFTVYKLDKPERVVIDVANAQVAPRVPGLEAPLHVNSWSVSQVALQELGEEDSAVARLMVGFARPASYRVKAEGSDVVVTVTAREPRPEPTSDADAALRVREADKAKVLAEKARAEAEGEKAQARKREALAQEREAKAQEREADASRRQAEADERIAEASRRLQAAEERIAEAEAIQKAAAIAREQAERATALAERRRSEAEKVAGRALERQVRAEAASQVAEKRARDAEASGAADAAKRRREADAALVQAEARRKEAETAATDAEARRTDSELRRKDAEARRKAAEDAVVQAEARRSEAEQARRDADGRRLEAEKAREVAEAARDRAEAARRDAISAREKEEARARLVAEKRSEEEARARAAQLARGREEEARKGAETARHAAEAQRQEAEQVLARVEERRRIAEAAQGEAEARRREAEAAAVAAESLARKRGVSAEEIERARAEAQRLEKAKRDADDQLANRRKELATEESLAKKAASERERAVAEAEAASRTLAHAKRARDEEERRIVLVKKELAAEEKRLADAREARAKEEARLAEAEARRKQAEQLASRAPEKVVAQPPKVAQPAASAAQVAAAQEEPAPAIPAGRARVRLKDVDFVDRPDAARVVLDFAGPVQPMIIAASGKQAILEVAAVDIAPSLERALDTSDFGGPVTAVSSYRDPRNPTRIRVVVDLAQATRSELKRAGNAWHWDFAKPAQAAASRAAAPKPAGQAPAPRATTYAPPVVGAYGAATTPVTSQTVAQAHNKKVYRGRRIDLDFKDADIHNMLRLLAEVGGVNIVVPDDVKAAVTVRLRNVPWDQAMEVVLASKGLWYRREGNLVRVAPREQLDAEDKAELERVLSRMQQEPPDTEIFTLNYAKADDLKDQVKSLLSPRGKLEVDLRTNSIILSDILAHRQRIVQLLGRLDTQTPQIQIEARIVEARSTWVREFGIQWGFGATASAATGNPTGLIFPNAVGVAGGATDSQTPTSGVLAASPNFAVNLPAAVGTGQGGAVGFTFGSVGGNFNLALRLSAAEDTGAVRIVTSPKITVLNNAQARISQGVSIPISVVSSQGVQTQFVPADLSLETTPHVSQRDCSIMMEINVTKNEADFVNTGARGDPSILRKEARTTMLIADGETTVIGGIYTRNAGLSFSKVPFLADIPILGWFFKSRRENDERTEVLIFLTPKITNKASLRCETPSRE